MLNFSPPCFRSQQMAEIAGNWMSTSSHKVKFVRKTVPTKVELLEEGPPRRLKVEFKNTETGETGSEEYNTVSVFETASFSCTRQSLIWVLTRAHKNGRLEEEHVTPIEARSLVKIIELY